MSEHVPKTLLHQKGPFAARRRRRWTRWIVGGLLPGAALIVLAHVLDRPVFDALAVTKAHLSEMEESGLYRLVWLMGTLWVWLVVAMGLYLHDRAPVGLGLRPALGHQRDPGARAIAVAGSVVLAGAVAEVLKLIIGRERPTRLIEGEFIEQMYVFKPVLGALRDSSNLGMPSSHAAVAFAGAVAMALVAPTQRGLVLSLAGLCALSRIVASAHTLSDVVVGALVGVVMAVWVSRWSMRRAAPGVVPDRGLGWEGGL